MFDTQECDQDDWINPNSHNTQHKNANFLSRPRPRPHLPLLL